MNTESQEIIELGTNSFPYKNIGLAFVEILNFHSHTKRNVTIFLKEYTTNYMSQTQNYIVNMTEVIIDSYNDSPSNPEKAILFGVKEKINLLSITTIFNLLKTDTLKLKEKIEIPGITDSEKSLIQGADSNIYVMRSNFKINRMYLRTDTLNQFQTLSIFIKALYLQERKVTITNSDIKVTGGILETIDPLSLHLENVLIDYHASMFGFLMLTICNYPEGNKTGLIYANNITGMYSIDRTAFLKDEMITHYGGADLIIKNSYFDLYAPLSNDK